MLGCHLFCGFHLNLEALVLAVSERSVERSVRSSRECHAVIVTRLLVDILL